MTAKIKICGLKRPEDIDYVNEYRPDYAGFVFYPPSLRYVTLDKCIELKKNLSPEITPVGVFLDNTLEEILAIAESGAVQILQVHGKNAPLQVEKLKEIVRLPVWEAIQINSEDDLQKAENSLADMILLDHGQGGTGKSFDWSLLENLRRNFILAGGLNASNIRAALKCEPYAVDVSSGVETNKIKDRDKIKEFIQIVRSQEEN